MSTNSSDFKISLISNYLHSSLKLKEDQWKQFRESDNGKLLLREFLESRSLQILFFSLNQNGILTASKSFSTKTQHKICYFINTLSNNGNENQKSFSDLLCGDLQPNLLKSVSAFLQSVKYFIDVTF